MRSRSARPKMDRTPPMREQYFKWFYKAFQYKGGHCYIGYVDEARKAALENVPSDKLAYYNSISGDSLLTNSGRELATNLPQPNAGKRWTMDMASPLVANGLANADFEDGKNMFAAVLCSSCHRINGEGGEIGPDLTQLGTRFSYNDILEAIIEPNSTISSQYASTVFYLKDGSSVMGRLVRDDDNDYYVSQNPFAPQDLRKLPKNSVVRTQASKVSIMPPGLINSLNEDELKDLLAYLKSGGNKDNEVYKNGNQASNK